MRTTAMATLAVFLAAATAHALAPGRADGTMTVAGKSTKLEHAVAKKSPDGVVVLLSNVPVTVETLDDIGAMLDLADSGKLTGIQVTIRPDKRIISGQLYSPRFNLQGNSFSAVGMHDFTASKMTAGEVAGTLSTTHPSSFNKVDYSYSAKFDAKIETPKPPPAPMLKGTALPPGGGELGKTYLAFEKNLSKGDIAALIEGASEQRAKQMKDAPPDELKQMIPLLQAMQPKDIKITGGSINGDMATLLATGNSDGDPATGTINMVREHGKWKVDKESWKSKH